MTAFGPYPARVVDVHDGDTVVLDIDLGFDHLISGRDWDGRTRLSCRVFGINAPELVTAAGKAARAYAQEFLAPGDRVTVVSYGWDKYGGRFDGYRVVTESNDRVVYLTPAQAQRFLNNWWIGTTKWVNLPWGQRHRIWQLSGRKIPADRPSVTATPLVDQTATIGQNFTYTFAANTFTNPDNSSPNYVYSARRTNGLFLPGWLTFNPLTRTFFGKPPTGSAGTYSIRVFAQDAFGRVYSDDFNIVVS
jgi:hypothetical protein